MRILLAFSLAAGGALSGGCSGSSSGTPFVSPTPKMPSGAVDIAVQNDAISNFGFTSIRGSGSFIPGTAFSVMGVVKTGAKGFRITAEGPPDPALHRVFDVECSLPAAMKVGDIIPVASSVPQISVFARVSRLLPLAGGFQKDDWESASASLNGSNGSLRIAEFSATKLKVELRDVRVRPLRNDVTLVGRAHGTLTLNGSFTLSNFAPF